MYYLIAISGKLNTGRYSRFPQEIQYLFNDVTQAGNITGIHDRLAHAEDETRYVAENRGLPLTDVDLARIAEIAYSHDSQIEIYLLKPLDVMKRKPSK